MACPVHVTALFTGLAPIAPGEVPSARWPRTRPSWALGAVLSGPNPAPGLQKLALIAAATVVCVAALASAVLLVHPELVTAFANSASAR